MKKYYIVLLLAYALLVVYSQNNMTVTVDQKNGDDIHLCADGTLPCQSIQYALEKVLHKVNISTINIKLIGNYSLNEKVDIKDAAATLSNLVFTGHYDNTVIKAGFANANFEIDLRKSDSNVTIQFYNLTFINFTSNATAVIVSWNGSIKVFNSIFFENKCAAINTLDASVELYGNIFENNIGSAVLKRNPPLQPFTSFPEGNESAGGAVAILFSERSNTHVVVKENTFQFNRAVSIIERLAVSNVNSYARYSHIGGGLLLGFMNKSNYINVLVDSNTFSLNGESLGGGVMLSFNKMSGCNNVKILNSRLLTNTASITGGGLAFTAWSQSTNNRVDIRDSQIAYNSAQVGGGSKFLFQSADVIDPSSPGIQIINLVNVTFLKNEAASASGLHLIYNLGSISTKPPVPVHLTNVTFSQHNFQSYPASHNGPSSYSGVFLSNSVDVVFQQDNFFLNNSLESPIFLSNSDLHLNGSLKFLGNTVQTSGGGMSLSDVSHIYLHAKSNISFVENLAQISGGAMFVKSVGYPDLVYKNNPSCFFQYRFPNTSPSKWEVSREETVTGFSRQSILQMFKNVKISSEKCLRWRISYGLQCHLTFQTEYPLAFWQNVLLDHFIAYKYPITENISSILQEET